MKFKVVFVFMALIIISCGKLGEKPNDSLNIGSNDAGKIIAYNNAMVDYLNDASNIIEKAGKDYVEMSTMVAKKEEASMFMGTAFMGSIPDVKKLRNDISLLEPGNSFPSEIKVQLTNNIQSISEAFENTHNAYQGFKNYLEKEDYNDDDWTKGKELVDVIEKNILDFYDKRSICYAALKPLADEAEIKLLEGHPLSETLTATKKDLILAEDIVAIVYAELIDMTALSTKYDELEANYSKHKNLTPALLKQHNKTLNYNNFYEEIESFLGEVRKSKRDEKIEDDEAENIGRAYQRLISFYNSFV